MPLDLNTLKALKRCSLGLDLYLWLAYRTFALNRPVRITWRQLYCQFGVDPTKANEHRTVQPELCTDSLCECGCVRSGLAVVVRW